MPQPVEKPASQANTVKSSLDSMKGIGSTRPKQSKVNKSAEFAGKKSMQEKRVEAATKGQVQQSLASKTTVLKKKETA